MIAPSAVQCGGSGNMCTQCFPGQICLSGLCSTVNSGAGGGAVASTCGTWTWSSSMVPATTGRTNATSTVLTDEGGSFSCADSASLLCLEQ